MAKRPDAKRVAFVSTRIAGTDGVSLEIAKWAHVLWDYRHVSYWYAGKLDRDPHSSMLVPEAYFYDRDNVWINERAFGIRQRTPALTRKISDVFTPPNAKLLLMKQSDAISRRSPRM